jgi:glycosyltransferase involved in cell wall biosynthesis
VAAVHQVVPWLERHDAIGDEVRAIQQLLRDRGHVSDVFTLHSGPDTAGTLADLCASPLPDAVLYHFATASPATIALARARLPLILLHHNVTPAAYFRGIDRAHHDRCRLAASEVTLLRGRTLLALADSDFTRRQLESDGFAPTGVLPLVLDPSPYRDHRPGKLAAEIRAEPGPVFLVVGRVAPNKRIEEAIRLLHLYRRGVDDTARLWIIGDDQRLPRYRAALDGLLANLGETGVRFTGKVSTQDLLDAYSAARVLLCMSDHEGFGVPLLEAMLIGLPVLAMEHGAVGETLGPAGVRLTARDLPLAAELLHMLATDEELRRRQVALGRRRAAELSPERAADCLIDHLASIGIVSTSSPQQ